MAGTIVALSTPFGLSAIAKIRASGPLVQALIKRHLNKEQPASHRAFLAYYRDCKQQTVDQVIATFFDAEHAYTGEDSVEIDCHGNPLIIQNIIEDLIADGCQMAGHGEFTQRAYLNHRLDLSQAEAVLDVIHASNNNALAVAQKQLQGALSEKIQQLSDKLLNLLALVESHIDFSDEEISSPDQIFPQIDFLLQEIDKIIAQHHFRSPLINGIKVAIVGHPNAGKSSLLNALLGDERALVSDIPGTTRDFISESITIDGFLIKFIDTAGLRQTADTIENLGIQKTLSNISQADICLIVVDGHHPQPLSKEIIRTFREKSCILVVNKIDLEQQQFTIPETLKSCQKISISAKNSTHIEALKSLISQNIRERNLLPDADTIVINERHKIIFEQVKEFLLSARNIFQLNQSFELCASDLRQALETLGQITGKYDNEAMLDKIFSQFCIGK